MTLLSRHVVVMKAYEEVYQIIQSSAYCLPKGIFSKESFSIYCAKRFNGGIVSLIPVKGTITQHSQSVEVMLSIPCYLHFYLGCFLSVFGIFGLLCCFTGYSSRWLPCVGSILFGILVIGQSLWEGRTLLDRLENKLLG